MQLGSGAPVRCGTQPAHPSALSPGALLGRFLLSSGPGSVGWGCASLLHGSAFSRPSEGGGGLGRTQLFPGEPGKTNWTPGARPNEPGGAAGLRQAACSLPTQVSSCCLGDLGGGPEPPVSPGLPSCGVRCVSGREPISLVYLRVADAPHPPRRGWGRAWAFLPASGRVSPPVVSHCSGTIIVGGGSFCSQTQSAPLVCHPPLPLLSPHLTLGVWAAALCPPPASCRPCRGGCLLRVSFYLRSDS